MAAVNADPVQEGYEAWKNREWDVARALWMPRALEGDARAQFYLSVLYGEGLGVERDLQQALTWLKSAAEGGMRTAQFYLGEHYRMGDWVERDEAEAARWWHLAAEAGMAKAQFKLGLLYALGRGVDHDRKQAVYWYRRAAANGFEQAKEALRLLGEPLQSVDESALAPAPAPGVDVVSPGAEQGKPRNNPALSGGVKQQAFRPRPDDHPAKQLALDKAEIKIADQAASVAGTSSVDAAGLKDDVDWILAQPENNYTLQLAASTSLEALRRLAERVRSRGKWVFFPYQRDQQRWFGILSGSFERYSEAAFSVEGLPPEILRAKPWVRRFGALRKYILGSDQTPHLL